MFSAAPQLLSKPGQWLNWYPENAESQGDVLERLANQVRCHWTTKRLRYAGFKSIARQVNELVAAYTTLSTQEFEHQWLEQRRALQSTGLSHTNLVSGFALAKLGVKQEFGFDLHDEQLFCAWALMHGVLTEMATGEGKSVTAAVAAIIAAASGSPVHVITTNDYLVERDAISMQALFTRFGLSSGYVGPNNDDDERRQAYAKDICYVSNKQLVFDYLRDRQTLGNRPGSIQSRMFGVSKPGTAAPLLRGLCFAIVDEADSVLIDDAITPLILSQQVDGDTDAVQVITAISLARRLNEGDDFSIDRRVKSIALSDAGEAHLAESASGLDGVWKNRRFRHELVRQALSAINLFHRDVDYLVRDGEVVLIDQSTGRVMPDRKLQQGLHQMLETKERCELSGQSETISSLSFQNYFQRYKHLCGMTGTASEAVSELRSVYRMPVVKIPTHSPNARQSCQPTFGMDEDEHLTLLLKHISTRHKTGQPLLVGTRSLAQSERLSELLVAAGLRPTLLNARQDGLEAEIVSQAGQRGAITIATNIAGRGTDIPVPQPIRELGGLHVIVAELNENQRIDRQLIGRCARQGDPGTYEYLLNLDDELLARQLPALVTQLKRVKRMTPSPLWHSLCLLVSKRAQSRQEKQQRQTRKQVAKADTQMQKRLSFAGYQE